MNAIVVVSDSFRRDHIGAFGNDWIRTPRLDRFAAQSTVFPNFRMGSFATIPQRTDLYTGRYSYAQRPWQPLEPEDVILPELLSEAGVEAYCSADTPHLFRSAQLTFLRGFNAFHWSRGSEADLWWSDHFGEGDYRPPEGKGRVRTSEERYRRMVVQGGRRVEELDWTTPQTFQAAIEWLTHNHRRERFFLYIDTFDPHEPWDPPRWASDLYLDGPVRRPYAWAEYGSADQYGSDELARLRALYAGECTVVDRWFGRLIDTVDLLGLDENTLVVFLSDHGHYLGYPGDGGQVGKRLGYRHSDGKHAGQDADVFIPLLDTVSNPPCMIRMPGQRRARSCNELAQPVDLMPTLLEAAKVPVPDGIDGTSLLPWLAGGKGKLRSRAVTACHRDFAQITDRRWLYGAWAHDHPAKLFDRRDDPDQTTDVLAQNPDTAQRLHRALIAELRRLDAPADWIAAIDAKAP
jgi:arylsulfatase A-like enzyme